ncbi:hypothetical protein DUI87_31030 [Hirundo rustica rustica]|uniref:G-protein coupled receptors family 1 profile domain-containing protein n=1 Tax=Hirundo rustica rustica TaxID=333673 RepID=A0A3M0IX62_HIRRU|nr:hypothetical protein DUI87_31030 [Hirundo rustica rustica]
MPELPERPEVAFVLSCLLVFGLALFGKCLVLHVVTRSRAMRTVAHIFVCSLALSDLLVAAFCVPFTVLQNISSKRLGAETAAISRGARNENPACSSLFNAEENEDCGFVLNDLCDHIIVDHQLEMQQTSGESLSHFVTWGYEELERQLEEVYKERSNILHQLLKTSKELQGLKVNLQRFFVVVAISLNNDEASTQTDVQKLVELGQNQSQSFLSQPVIFPFVPPVPNSIPGVESGRGRRDQYLGGQVSDQFSKCDEPRQSEIFRKLNINEVIVKTDEEANPAEEEDEEVWEDGDNGHRRLGEAQLQTPDGVLLFPREGEASRT